MNTVPFLLSLLITTSLLTQPQAFAMGDELQLITFTVSFKKPIIFPEEEKRDTSESVEPKTGTMMTEEQKKASRDLGAVLSSQASSLELLRKIALGTSSTSSRSPSSTKLKGSSDAIVFSKPGSSSAALAISEKEATADEFFISSTQKLEAMFIEVQSFKQSTTCREKLEKPLDFPGKKKITGTECLNELFDFLCATIGSLSNAFPNLSLSRDLETYKQFYITKSKAEASLKAMDEAVKSALISDTKQNNPLLQELQTIFKLKESMHIFNKRLTVIINRDEIGATESDEFSFSSGLISPRSESPSSLRSPRSGSPTVTVSSRPSSSKSEEKTDKKAAPLRNRSVSVGTGQAPQMIISEKEIAKKSGDLKRTASISAETSDIQIPTSSHSTSPKPSDKKETSEDTSEKKPRTLLGRLRSLSIGKKDKSSIVKSGSKSSIASSSDEITKRTSVISFEGDEEGSSSSSAEKKSPSPSNAKRN